MHKILKFLKKILRNGENKQDSTRNSDVVPIILSNIRKDIVTVLDIGCGKLWDNNPRPELIFFLNALNSGKSMVLKVIV